MPAAFTRFLRLPLLAQTSARRGIASKPATRPMSTADNLVGFTVFVVGFLLPSGWILSNMESYKKRD